MSISYGVRLPCAEQLMQPGGVLVAIASNSVKPDFGRREKSCVGVEIRGALAAQPPDLPDRMAGCSPQDMCCGPQIEAALHSGYLLRGSEVMLCFQGCTVRDMSLHADCTLALTTYKAQGLPGPRACGDNHFAPEPEKVNLSHHLLRARRQTSRSEIPHASICSIIAGMASSIAPSARTAPKLHSVLVGAQKARRPWRRMVSHSVVTPAHDLEQLDSSDFLAISAAQATSKKVFDPAKTSRGRNRQLPPSRYQYKSPRYYRGPLHPHQPPRPSDPASREFQAGPFSLPRLEQTYHDTFAADYMTMAYMHFPPGTQPHKKGERLRSWVGDSPYFKNRPLRGPRGGDVLRLLRKPITFRNVPQLTGITLHTMVKEARKESSHLHVAGMVMQAITGTRPQVHTIKKSASNFEIRAGQHLSLTCKLVGEDMHHFVSKIIDVVMPKIKDWKGIKGSSGDSSGNIAFGFTPEDVAMFPEIEVNYDAYPPKMIPGCHVVIHTSATNDQDARLFLTQIGKASNPLAHSRLPWITTAFTTLSRCLPRRPACSLPKRAPLCLQIDGQHYVTSNLMAARLVEYCKSMDLVAPLMAPHMLDFSPMLYQTRDAVVHHALASCRMHATSSRTCDPIENTFASSLLKQFPVTSD
nr:putative 54s ribosomal protein l7, mitochondrial [Quercus suber]